MKGPKFSKQVGMTPIMESEQVRQLLDSIPIVRKLTALIDSFLASQVPEEEKKNLIEATGRVVDDVKKGGRLTGATKMFMERHPWGHQDHSVRALGRGCSHVTLELTGHLINGITTRQPWRC